jgi:hypothetical protein
MRRISKINLKDISYFANIILLFSIIIDPANVFFGIKDIAFLFFVATSFPYARFKNVYIFITFCMVYFITFSVGIITNQDIDFAFAFGALKSFLFLSYLFWMAEDYLHIFSNFYKLSLLMSIIVIILYILMSIFRPLEAIIYAFFTEKNNFIRAGRRMTLGIRFYTVFFPTSPISVISLSVALFFLFSKRKIKYFLHSCIFFLCLFFSGTRANMLSGILIVIFLTLFYLLYYKKSLLTFVVTFCSASVIGMILIMLLLTDRASRSSIVKSGHSESTLLLFSENPLRFLFIGTGPGSTFYTTGFDEVTAQTELTYFELIRNYGLLFTLLIISILCVPFLNIINNKHYDKLLKFSLLLGYLSYLFIAGTNPLLLSSTGLIVIAVMFYISNNNILREKI